MARGGKLAVSRRLRGFGVVSVEVSLGERGRLDGGNADKYVRTDQSSKTIKR
jgi:hypothetical protein